jgi:hypothetical protein
MLETCPPHGQKVVGKGQVNVALSYFLSSDYRPVPGVAPLPLVTK